MCACKIIKNSIEDINIIKILIIHIIIHFSCNKKTRTLLKSIEGLKDCFCWNLSLSMTWILQVNNISDSYHAMLLYRLLEHVFKNGIYIQLES